MKIECWAIGKPHESYVDEGIKDFTKRIENYYPFEWRLFNLKKNSGAFSHDKLKHDESLLIMGSLKPEDWLVSLDEKGKSFNSKKLAGFIQDRGQ